LQRDKNAVKEVHAGFECAFMVENFTDWQIDDRVECFLERPEVKK
jgi:translation initiation factor IF-2